MDDKYVVKTDDPQFYSWLGLNYERCSKKQLFEMIGKLEAELDKHDSTWRMFIDIEDDDSTDLTSIGLD